MVGKKQSVKAVCDVLAELTMDCMNIARRHYFIGDRETLVKKILNGTYMKKLLSISWVHSSSSASKHLRSVGDSYNSWASLGDIFRRGRKEKGEIAKATFIACQ